MRTVLHCFDRSSIEAQRSTSRSSLSLNRLGRMSLTISSSTCSALSSIPTLYPTPTLRSRLSQSHSFNTHQVQPVDRDLYGNSEPSPQTALPARISISLNPSNVDDKCGLIRSKDCSSTDDKGQDLVSVRQDLSILNDCSGSSLLAAETERMKRWVGKPRSLLEVASMEDD